MKYDHIEAKLKAGGKLHGFRSGGGLRVIRIDKGKKLLAYGEAGDAAEALVLLEEDAEAGGRPYKEVYGKSRPHFLTGGAPTVDPLDRVLVRGGNCDAEWKDGTVTFTTSYSEDRSPPQELIDRSIATGQVEMWSDEGFTFRIVPSIRHTGSATIETVEVPPGTDHMDVLFRKVVREGTGATFAEAIAQALEG